MTLDIFGMKIKVIIVEGFTKKTGYVGFCCMEKKTITIDANLSKDEFAQTLFHEFFHAVFFRTGLAQSKTSVDAHEITVENFATAMVENAKVLKKYL